MGKWLIDKPTSQTPIFLDYILKLQWTMAYRDPLVANTILHFAEYFLMLHMHT
jgi:hypothetical protein